MSERRRASQEIWRNCVDISGSIVARRPRHANPNWLYRVNLEGGGLKPVGTPCRPVRSLDSPRRYKDRAQINLDSALSYVGIRIMAARGLSISLQSRFQTHAVDTPCALISASCSEPLVGPYGIVLHLAIICIQPSCPTCLLAQLLKADCGPKSILAGLDLYWIQIEDVILPDCYTSKSQNCRANPAHGRQTSEWIDFFAFLLLNEH